MNKLKQLTEKHAELLAQTETLDTTKPEERAKLDGLIAEIKETDAAIKTEVEIQNIRSRAAPDLSKQDKRDIEGFDFAVILRHLNNVAQGRRSNIDGLEAEILEQGAKEARAAGIEPHGVMLPRAIVQKRALVATGQPQEGGLTIATEKRGLLDDFFASSVMVQAGATVLSGLVGNVDLPRVHASTAKPKGKAENEKAEQIEPSFAMLSLTPKRLPAFIRVSEQLLMQSSSAIEAVLRNHLSTELGVLQETAFYHGTGDKEATGILATTGIASVAGGQHGAKPSWGKLVELETAIDTKNALLGRLHYITNSAVRGTLKTTPVIGDTMPVFLLDANNSSLNGYSPLFTNCLKSDLVKGNSGPKCSPILFGNFADYAIGYWGGVALEMIRGEDNALHGRYTLVASTYYDGGVLRPKSFAAMTDVLTA